MKQVFILVASHIVNLELGGPVFGRSFAYFPRAVAVGILNAVVAREFNREQQVFGVYRYSAVRREPACFFAVYLENVFVLRPLKAVGIIFIIRVV